MEEAYECCRILPLKKIGVAWPSSERICLSPLLVREAKGVCAEYLCGSASEASDIQGTEILSSPSPPLLLEGGI